MNLRRTLQGDWLWARVHLGMTKEEFFALTPSEWSSLCEHWVAEQKRRQDREDRLVARLLMCMNLMLVPRKEGDLLPTEDDYMPKPVVSDEDAELKESERLRQLFMQATARNKHEGLDHGSGT